MGDAAHLPVVLPDPAHPQRIASALRCVQGASLHRRLAQLPDDALSAEHRLLAEAVRRRLRSMAILAAADLVEILVEPLVAGAVLAGDLAGAARAASFELACRGRLDLELPVPVPPLFVSTERAVAIEPGPSVEAARLADGRLELAGRGVVEIVPLADTPPDGPPPRLARLRRPFVWASGDHCVVIEDVGLRASGGDAPLLADLDPAAWSARLEEALALVGRVLSDARSEMRRLLRCLVPAGLARNAGDVVRALAPGAVWIALPPTAVLLAEGLVAALQRVKLDILLEQDRLVEGGASPSERAALEAAHRGAALVEWHRRRGGDGGRAEAVTTVRSALDRLHGARLTAIGRGLVEDAGALCC